MSGVEFWTWANGRGAARRAARAEARGWDGIGMGDSQSLQLDCYVALALAASATTTLQLATAVTNPLTRLPAVTAGAIASLHAESGGRATLGIGRGDSALAHLGLAPASVGAFTRYLDRVQGYLRGSELPFEVADGRSIASSIDTLAVAGGPSGSRLRWLDPALPKVAVDVAVSGPRMIRAAALLAEQLTFAVGVDPARLRWAIDIARTALADEGRRPDELRFGAYVPMLVHRDREVARDAVSGMAASVARFSVMHGTVAGPMAEADRAALGELRSSYDLREHFTHGAAHAQVMTGDLVDSWAIAGDPEHCIERFSELIELGISKVFVLDAGFGVDPEVSRASRGLFFDEVVPALRATGAAAGER